MRFLILGAGPAGLAFANSLAMKGESSFVVLDREMSGGGLCRSMMVDGAPFDIGGGHFLDVRNPKVNAFLFSFMPESEWVQYKKICKIMIEGAVIDYPFEANIWELPAKEQVEYLKSIAVAGCNRGDPMPERFVSWIYWKLGDKIAKNYMIPYNEKLYGGELDRLGTYWLEKLPNVSFEETLISCLEKRPYGKHPGHVRFYYPREYGYGEIWRRMAEQIGGHIEYGKIVKAIDFNSKIVTTADGERYRADTIITTIPWMEFTEIVGMPESIQNSIQELKFSSRYKQNIMPKIWIRKLTGFIARIRRSRIIESWFGTIFAATAVAIGRKRIARGQMMKQRIRRFNI